MKTNKKTMIFAGVFVLFACAFIIFSFGVPGKRTYIGVNIGKEAEIEDIAIITEEQEAGEPEIIAKQEQEEFPKELERIEKGHGAIDPEMPKKEQEEFPKEMVRIEKEHKAIEAEMEKRQQEELLKERERIEKEHEALEAEMEKRYQGISKRTWGF